MRTFTVYIQSHGLVGCDVLVKDGVWLKTRFSTWTKRGARRQARKWCRRRDAFAQVFLIEY